MAKKFKSKNVYKQSRDKEDADIELKSRVVKLKDLVEFKGTPQQFLNRIDVKNTGYFYTKGEGLTHLWWYDSENWFMNTAHQSFKKIQRGGWFIAKDMLDIIDRHISRGGILYFSTK